MEIFLSINSKADGSVREVKRDIADGLVIGRGAEEGILLDGPDLSREHLALTADGNNIFVTDLSSNGTWLNGARLRKSVRTRMGFEDSIEVPGYVLTVKLAEQPAKTGEVAVAQLHLQPVADIPAPVPSKGSGPLAMLDPVFRFVGSFSFMEKVFLLVGLIGLFLLYTYFGT